MRILLLLFVLCLVSCNEKEWSKEALNKECLEHFKKKDELTKALSEKQMNALCECVSGKMFSKYKSHKDMEQIKNKEEVEQIGSDCALILLNDQ